MAWCVLIAIVVSGASYGVGHLVEAKRLSHGGVPIVIHSGIAVDDKVLHEGISSEGLNVYWVGPKRGEQYILTTSNTDGISLRYVASTTSVSAINQPYIEVGTYAYKNTFAITKAAALRAYGVGFINSDGNAVYYDSRDPKNVYVGIKGADIQVEIYDPVPDQSLELAFMKGEVRRII